MTPEKLKTYIVGRLLPKYKADLTWADIVTAFQNADQESIDLLLSCLCESSINKAGRVLNQVVIGDLRRLAGLEADDMMVDGTLSFEEIDRILG